MAFIIPGEYVDVYLQYDTGSYRNCTFSWSVSDAGTHNHKSLDSFSNEIRVKANTHGTLKIKMRIASNDQVIATDELHISVFDTRTDWEKFRDKIKDILQEIYLMLGFTLGPIWSRS